MCAPTFRGAAYLAASVFVYRSIQLVLTAISCAITDYKMTYLNVPYLEGMHFFTALKYLISPLFFPSCKGDNFVTHDFYEDNGFALMGLDEESFAFVFYSALSLGMTLFIRYSAELAYIYAYDWSAFRLKTPSLFLNILVDAIFVAILLIYAIQELRDPVKKKERLINGSNGSSPYRGGAGTIRRGTAGITTPGSPGPLLSSTPTNNSNIRNEFERKNVKNSNIEAVVAGSSSSITSKPKSCLASRKGIGDGAEPGEALHYPITPVDKEILMKPLPPLPEGTPHDSEFDDISLPPHIPLASPDYDDV